MTISSYDNNKPQKQNSFVIKNLNQQKNFCFHKKTEKIRIFCDVIRDFVRQMMYLHLTKFTLLHTINNYKATCSYVENYKNLHFFFPRKISLTFGAEKRDDKNSFVKKTRARIACVISFDETFRLIPKSLSILFK